MKLKKDITIYEIAQKLDLAARNLINHLQAFSNINLTNTIVVRSDLIIRDSSLRKKINDYA